MLKPDEIEKLLKSNQIGNSRAFEILQSICSLASRSQGHSDGVVQSLILRVLDKREQFEEFSEILNGLIRHYGLYPYLHAESLSIKDALAREFHRPSLITASVDQDIEKPGENEGLVFS